MSDSDVSFSRIEVHGCVTRMDRRGWNERRAKKAKRLNGRAALLWNMLEDTELSDCQGRT
jgi:hypothetical protein